MEKRTRAGGNAGHRTTAAARRNSDIPFFLGLILFTVFALGAVIVGQKMTIHYFVRQFPLVAEHNFRALQADLRAVEARLTSQLTEVSNACITVRQTLPIAPPVMAPPAPDLMP